MNISKDRIRQEQLNSLTLTLLARAHPLHLSIRNIKKALIYTRSNLLLQRTPHREKDILPIITPFSDIGESITATTHKNWQTIANDATLSTIWSSKPLSGYTKSSSIHNYSSPHKHVAQTRVELDTLTDLKMDIYIELSMK